MHAQKSAGMPTWLLQGRDRKRGGVAHDRHVLAYDGFDLIEYLLFNSEIFEDALDDECARSEIAERGRWDISLGPSFSERCGKIRTFNQFSDGFADIIAGDFVRVATNRVADDAKSVREQAGRDSST
jgi:hypothetical protein